jgi:hypothetical protein
VITLFAGVTSVSAITGKAAASAVNDPSGRMWGYGRRWLFGVGVGGDGGGIGEEWVCYSWIPHGLRVTRDSISTAAGSHLSGWA